MPVTKTTAQWSSVLYEKGADRISRAPLEAPAYFYDLHLDRIVDAITAGKEEYNLRPFFYASLQTPEEIFYRHEVMHDLDDGEVRGCIDAFAQELRAMRQTLAQGEQLREHHQATRWFLRATEIYCAAVQTLAQTLPHLQHASRGLRGFVEYLTRYQASESFTTLVARVRGLSDELARVRYTVLIKDNGFTVRKYHGEENYSDEIAATFQKFQGATARDERSAIEPLVMMNSIEAKILEFVTRLYPEVFAKLDAFVEENRDFADPVILAFDREIQFYIAYREYMRPFEGIGLPFCYPDVSAADKNIHAHDGFDLALAGKLLSENQRVVCNDLELHDPERALVVSGPNQGGKTTFARMFGQLHHLAGIGVPVPGRSARLWLFDTIFVHFEKEERIENLHGKLQDDLLRIHEILQRATPRSIILLNEIFTSTALEDAVFLSRHILERILDLDALCVCVTFLDELASLNEKTVSMVSTVDPDDAAVRTYKVVRRPADGRSYAMSIAEKYGLTSQQLISRLPSV